MSEPLPYSYTIDNIHVFKSTNSTKVKSQVKCLKNKSQVKCLPYYFERLGSVAEIMAGFFPATVKQQVKVEKREEIMMQRDHCCRV